MSAARDWITRPASERAKLEADGWRFDIATTQKQRWGAGYHTEQVVVMWRQRGAELAGDAA